MRKLFVTRRKNEGSKKEAEGVDEVTSSLQKVIIEKGKGKCVEVTNASSPHEMTIEVGVFKGDEGVSYEVNGAHDLGKTLCSAT